VSRARRAPKICQSSGQLFSHRASIFDRVRSHRAAPASRGTVCFRGRRRSTNALVRPNHCARRSSDRVSRIESADPPIEAKQVRARRRGASANELLARAVAIGKPVVDRRTRAAAVTRSSGPISPGTPLAEAPSAARSGAEKRPSHKGRPPRSPQASARFPTRPTERDGTARSGTATETPTRSRHSCMR
jgi:hypothetical protein